ncbi:FecR family protein [Winogradskyella sp.]|uniref:FecR family protein n=1 Tax=Winogradskyella sp. TaxID=1883156 RepID=UPI003F6AFD37
MNREDLIKKWLDNNLNSEEQNAFENLDDYNELIKMNNALKGFKAPHFDAITAYNNLSSKLNSSPKTKKQWLRPLLKIAAILALGFSVYYYSTTLDTNFNTQIAQQTTIELPDESVVELNSNSSLVFNEKSWNESRQVKLDGEAFFKVAKGKKFDVITEDGIVSVLGTHFNVKQRKNYFEVTCYEGLVAVSYKDKTQQLKSGNNFKVIDGKYIANEKEDTTQPWWLKGESYFKVTPLKYVISELQNQYDVKINTDQIDTSRLFTGSFIHNNIDLALQSVTIPLNLTYSKLDKTIILKRE